MIVRRSIYIACFSALIAIASAANATAQLPDSKLGVPGCQFTEMYRQEGWKISGHSGSVPKGSRLTLSVSPGGIVPGVFVTEMKGGKESATLLLPKCSPDFPSRLIIRETTVRVLQMSKVDYQGRVFAYVVRYEPQIVENGVPRHTLGFVQVVFLDVDGSGRFTVMRYDDKGLFLASPEVPEWPKGSSQKPPPK